MDIKDRLALLSPEKRELLLRKLQENKSNRLALVPSDIEADKRNKYLPFPLVEVQQAYWMGQTGLFDLGTHASNIYIEFRINFEDKDLKEIIEKRTENALNRLVQYHDVLRLIVLPGGMQQILPEVEGYRIPFMDLSSLGETQIEERLEKIRRKMREEKTPILHWPLFEVLGHCFNNMIVMHVKINAILMDGISMHRFLAQWLQAIQGFDIEITETDFSYRDYALSWEAIKKTQNYHRGRSYWLKRMPELLPGPELPLATYLHPGTQCRFVVWDNHFMDNKELNRLNQLSVNFGVGLFSVLLTAYADVIAYWSYGAKFSIGVINTFYPPIHPQIEDVTGNFNTFGIVEINALAGSFMERAKAIQAQVIRNLDNPFFTGFQIVREMNKILGRGSHVPVTLYFNSVLNLQKMASQLNKIESEKQSKLERVGNVNSLIGVDVVETNLYSSQAQLIPTIYEGNNGEIRCKWGGRPELFPQGVMEDIFSVYKELVNRLVSEEIWYKHWPESISDIIKSSDRFVTGIQGIPNASGDVNDLILNSVRVRESHSAVTCPSVSLSYGELHRISSSIHERLLQAGVRPGKSEMVAVIMERGWEPIASLLGIFRAGASYLPIGANMPSDQIGVLLRENNVKAVLTQSWVGQQVRLPEKIGYIYVDECISDIFRANEPSIQVQADQAACVLYNDAESMDKTVLSYGMVVDTILSSNRYFAVTDEDRLLSLSPHTVYRWLYDVLSILFAGGTIVLPGAQRSWEPVYCMELVQREQVTVWNSPVHIWEEALTFWEKQLRGKECPLRLILLSGTKVGRKIVTRIKDLNHEIQIFHLWGNEEVGLWSMSSHLNEGKYSYGTRFNRCFAGRHVYVMNDGLEQCPESVLGHVYFGGNDFIQTYSALNEGSRAKVFRHSQTGAWLLRTRYVGRYTDNNMIEICGSEDEYKLRFKGYSVSLADVEEKLEQHPDVRLVVAMAEQNDHFRARLTAYAVIRDGSIINADHLKIFLRNKLPYYAIPIEIHLVNSLPVRVDGNIDTSQLKCLAPIFNDYKPFIEPRCQIESRLLKIWNDILGEHQIICINDNWFDVGGDSLKWVQLKFLIEREFGKDIAPADFIKDATIEHLAELLR